MTGKLNLDKECAEGHLAIENRLRFIILYSKLGEENHCSWFAFFQTSSHFYDDLIIAISHIYYINI